MRHSSECSRSVELIDLGRTHCMEGRLAEGCACFLCATEVEPDAPRAWAYLGAALMAMRRTDDGIAAYRKSLELDAAQPVVWNNLAGSLSSRRQVQDALECFRRALVLTSDLPSVHSNYLLALNYEPSLSPEAVRQEHLDWAALHAASSEWPRRPRAPLRGRRIHVGYVSGSFFTHSTIAFLEPLLRGHNRTQFEIACYANAHRADAVTARLQGFSDRWRQIQDLSDEEACALIDEDGIDILVDLSGHTEGNRLTVFGRKPAPIQVTWLGYPNTTGLAEIDYRLTCCVSDPPGITDHLHTEKLVRLPGGFLCFQPPAGAPAVNDAPCTTNGYITFGCFNNIPKLTDATLRVWAAILRQVKGSRLLLKSRGLESDWLRKSLQETFCSLAVDPSRIEMYPFCDSPMQHLELYQNVDIALDTWPYNGTTTTCEALWMGVPVVTFSGNTHAARVGASLAAALRLEQCVAYDEQGYVAAACALADPAAAQRLRADLRARISGSNLMDSGRFARAVEAAYWRMISC